MTARRALVTALFAAVVVAAAASPAGAHAAYKDSNPADGETVGSPPSQVTAEFTEPLTDSSYLQVYDPCGDRVDSGDTIVSGYDMSVSMSGDKAGEYTVEFAAQSALDSHVTSGSFSFTSSGGPACEAQPTQPPSTGGGGGGGGGGSTGGGGGGSPESAGSGAGGGTSGVPGGSGGATGPAGSAGGKQDPSGKGGARGGSRRPSGGAPEVDGPVSFQNAGDRAPEQSPWDLPVGGVLMAFALCVMIGAAGGRVYAGIVAPPRR